MLLYLNDEMHAALYLYKQVVATITDICCITSGLGT